MQWYVSQNGKTTGPFDEERLAMLVQWGRISRNAFICDKQWSAWIAIRCSAFARWLPAEKRRRRFGGLFGAAAAGGSATGSSATESPGSEGSGAAVSGGEAADAEQTGSRQALGLVALSVILAGLLMATL
jgi:hypothetical protein